PSQDRIIRRACLAVLAFLLFAVPAQAFRLDASALHPVRGNPAEHLIAQPIDPETYDPATHCNPAPHKGVVAFTHWLERHSHGVFWGSYRCEMWGKHSASLHAENRAVDWHLDVTNPADRAEARRRIDLPASPASARNPPA